MFRSDVVFQLDRGGVLPLLKPPPSVRLALLVAIMILTRAMWRRDRPVSRTTTHPTGRRRRQESSWPSKRLVSMLHLILLLSSSHTVRLQTTPQPDLLHERSYRTCFEPDNPRRRTAAPVPTPPTPPMAARRASSTRQRRHSGSSLVGRPCCSTRTLVAVLSTYWWWLCCVARSPDVNVIYVRRLALPLMAAAPHPLAVALSYTPYTVSTPVLRLMRRRPVMIYGSSSTYILLGTCMAGFSESIANSYLRHLRVDRLESIWDRG